MYSSRAIANAILQIAHDSGGQLTNMQLQKLVYFAHGWHLALKDEPLFEDAVKAWNFGPVIPPLYNKLKKYGNETVTEPISTDETEPIDSYVAALLNRIYAIYGHMSGAQMSYLTHKEGTPWATTWKSEKFAIISNELIKKHFLTLRRPKSAE